MADPVISPDGKFVWTGSEWIPAPPTSAPTADSTINLEDSMMSGNVNLEQKSSDASSVINLKDSAMSGEINITQNNPDDIATAMIQALERMGFSGQSFPEELTPNQEAEVEQVLEMSEQLEDSGIEIDPWTEIALGKLANHASSRFPYHLSRDYYLSALEKFQAKQNWRGELVAYIGLSELNSRHNNDMRELEQIYHWIIRISEENGEQSTLSAHYFKLGLLAEFENELEKAKQYYEKVLIIDRERGNPMETTLALSRLGKIALWRSDFDSAEQFFNEVLTISKDYGEKEDEVSPLTNLAFIYYSQGDFHRAGQLFGNAQEIINSEKENQNNGYFTGDIN